MKSLLLFVARFYASVVLTMAALKPCFMLLNRSVYGGATIMKEWWSVVCGGFAMDCSMGAYFAMALCVILLALQWIRGDRDTSAAVKIYFGFVAAVLSMVFVLDSMLYGYWGFKLDTTPLFYFTSSPSLAFASVSGLEIFAGVAGVVVLAVALYFLVKFASGRIPDARTSTVRQRTLRSVALLVCCGTLFIPLRGGFTVSTMNLSSAYFSNDNRLNHAAVNPLFSLMYSATHSNDYDTAFAFFSDEEAERRFENLNCRSDVDSVEMKTLLNTGRPDIYIIILESFSNHLFPSLGGEPIAAGLDSIARTGLLFDRFYASGFRTDRGIPAVLSGYPAQPTTSVMKDVAKAESLPSIANSLSKAGYTAEYFYGGDANFTNMRAYLVSAGFTGIVSDKDFPISQRLSKWGVPDGPLFERVLESVVSSHNDGNPKLRVVQTSSSHEPFDVDRSPRSADEPREVTAFAYADSCATAFVDSLRNIPSLWNNALIVMVPDHYGCYPKGLTDASGRHAVPLIMTGGALALTGVDHTVGSQTDIAATLLTALDLPHDDFRFSKNLLDNTQRHYAFFSSPGDVSFVTADGCVTYNIDADRIDIARGDTTGLADNCRACLQTIYRDLSRR